MHNLLVILYKLLTTAFSISFLLIHAIVFIREYLMHHANEIHKTPQIHIIPIAISYSLPFYKNTLYETKNSGQLWSLFFVITYFIINTLKIIFSLEIYFCIIVAALEKFLHLLLARLSWVRSCTCIKNSIGSNLW